jgi:hypothetical protein
MLPGNTSYPGTSHPCAVHTSTNQSDCVVQASSRHSANPKSYAQARNPTSAVQRTSGIDTRGQAAECLTSLLSRHEQAAPPAISSAERSGLKSASGATSPCQFNEVTVPCSRSVSSVPRERCEGEPVAGQSACCQPSRLCAVTNIDAPPSESGEGGCSYTPFAQAHRSLCQF